MFVFILLCRSKRRENMSNVTFRQWCVFKCFMSVAGVLSGVQSGADVRFFYSDTIIALPMGSSAAHQRIRRLRFDLDKEEREGINVSPWGAPFTSWTHSSNVPSQFTDLPEEETCSLFYFHTNGLKADVSDKNNRYSSPLSSSFLCLSSIRSMLEYVTWR